MSNQTIGTKIYFTAKDGSGAEISGDITAIEAIEHAFERAGIKFNEQIETWDEGYYEDWERQQNEGEPLRSLPPRQTVYEADDGYNAAQGSHFNPNGWCRD